MDFEDLRKTHPGSDKGQQWLDRKKDVLPDNMSGMTVLDIGSYNGYYSLLAASRGASVLGIDVPNQWIDRTLYHQHIEKHGFDCKHIELDVYDLDELDEAFDLVLFYDVIYHLEHPLLALKKIFPKVRGSLLLGTYIIDPRFLNIDQSKPIMYFFEPGELTHDQTNVWGPTLGCVEKMLISTGFPVVKMLNYDHKRALFKASKILL